MDPLRDAYGNNYKTDLAADDAVDVSFEECYVLTLSKRAAPPAALSERTVFSFCKLD